jgi:hypothetical protein
MPDLWDTNPDHVFGTLVRSPTRSEATTAVRR